MRFRPVRLVLLGLAMAAVLLGGCGGDTATAKAVELPADTPEWLVQEIERMISEEATETQRLHLEDGIVTAAEREAAYLAYLACLEDNGIEILWYELKPTGDTLRGDKGDLSEAAEEQASLACRTEHYKVVGMVFVEQNGPSAEQEADWWREAGECMRELGHDVPVDPTKYELMEIDDFAALDCYDEAAGLR